MNRLDKSEQTRPFEVSAVPDELAFEVSAGLMFAGDREAVKSVFASVREETQTPPHKEGGAIKEVIPLRKHPFPPCGGRGRGMGAEAITAIRQIIAARQTSQEPGLYLCRLSI